MIDRTTEWPKIDAAAIAHGIDPRFVKAIRLQENGASGREFGVLSERAPTYDDQLRIICESVAHAVLDYGRLEPIFSQSAPYSLRYTPGFIAFFGHRWAPIGVENDPTDLNANWVPDVQRLYQEQVTEDAL